MDRRKRTARTVALMSLFSMTDTQENVPVASFDGDGSDLISLIVGIEPIQDLHGYDNPWPAGGGKNLVNLNLTPYLDATEFTLKRGTYTVSTKTPVTGDAWYFSGKKSDDSWCTKTEMGLDSFNNASNPGLFYGGADNSTITFICPEDNVTFKAGRLNTDGTNPMMVESGSTATSWEPYSNICPISGWTGANIHVSPTTDAEDGETYSITFPTEAGTVYGGTLDVTSGKLTVNRVKEVKTWGDFQYKTVLGNTARGTIDLQTTCVYPASVSVPQISNIAPHSANFSNDSVHFYCNGTQALFFLPVNTSDDTAIEISYELATPLVYDLTPTEVSTLIGTNNIWADTGDIKYIEYNI